MVEGEGLERLAVLEKQHQALSSDLHTHVHMYIHMKGREKALQTGVGGSLPHTLIHKPAKVA